MPDEHESAVAAWLDDPHTCRELQILTDRFPTWTEFQRIQIALSMTILAALDVYEDPITEIRTDEEIDEGDRWKSDPDATGYSP